MKKVFLLVTLLVSIISYGQDTTQPLHRAFVYAGTNWTPKTDLNYSLEGGTWGIKSNTSFSATFDFAFDHGKMSQWIGGKAYYTIHSEDKLCYMLYVAPKVSLQDKNGQLIEFGMNNNYTLTKDLLIGVTLGEQWEDTNDHNLFVSLGFVYLFRK